MKHNKQIAQRRAALFPERYFLSLKISELFQAVPDIAGLLTTAFITSGINKFLMIACRASPRRVHVTYERDLTLDRRLRNKLFIISLMSRVAKRSCREIRVIEHRSRSVASLATAILHVA